MSVCVGRGLTLAKVCPEARVTRELQPTLGKRNQSGTFCFLDAYLSFGVAVKPVPGRVLG